MVRELFWLTHVSAAAGANVRGCASIQGTTKLVVCRVEGQGEGRRAGGRGTALRHGAVYYACVEWHHSSA